MDAERVEKKIPRFTPMLLVEDVIPHDGSIWPEYTHTMIISVDSFDQKLACGRLHTFYFEEISVPFLSLDQLLFALEETMDRVGFPQRDTMLRGTMQTLPGHSAYKVKKKVHKQHQEAVMMPWYSPPNLSFPKGMLATYCIRPIFRYYSSMQGILISEDLKAESAFRSEMELLMLLRESLFMAWEEKEHKGRQRKPESK